MVDGFSFIDRSRVKRSCGRAPAVPTSAILLSAVRLLQLPFLSPQLHCIPRHGIGDCNHDYDGGEELHIRRGDIEEFQSGQGIVLKYQSMMIR